MISSTDARPNEETRPNFNEWGNPLFLPNNGDTRGSDPGYSMSYRPTSVPFRHIEDIVSRLGKVNAIKSSQASRPAGSPLLGQPPAQLGHAQPGQSAQECSPANNPRPPQDRTGSPSGATDLASASPTHATDTPPVRRQRLPARHDTLATLPRLRAHSAFESSPLATESSDPVGPPPRQRLSIRQSIHAFAVGTANSLRRSTRNPPQPDSSLSLEDAVHVTCFHCSANNSKKPVIPIPVIPHRRPRKRLWRRYQTWRSSDGIDEPVRSSSMGALASPSSMCMEDMSSLTHAASRSFLNTPSPGHPAGRDFLSRLRDFHVGTPLGDDSKGTLTPGSTGSHSAQLVASSPRAPPPPLSPPEPPPVPPPTASPDQGLLPPPPNIPITSQTRSAYAFDSYSSQSRECQLLQVASGPPHSSVTEVPSGRCDSGASPAPRVDSEQEMPLRDSLSGILGPPMSDSIDLGPSVGLPMLGSEASGELLGGVSAPAATQTAGGVSPTPCVREGGSPPPGRKFSMARRASPAAVRRARLADDFQSPSWGGRGRHPSAPLSPPLPPLSASPSEELRQPRRAQSQDTWTRVHACGVWHGQTLATLNSLTCEWQTLKRSLNNSRTSPHTSLSPASRRSLLSEHNAHLEAGVGDGGLVGAASTVGRHCRSHSVSAAVPSRPPHLPAGPVRRSDTSPALRSMRRGSQRKPRSQSGSAKAGDPRTTPFSPSLPLPAAKDNPAPAGDQHHLTNSARLHARRLAAIRAGLRGTVADVHVDSAMDSPDATDTSQSDVLPQARRPADRGDIRSGNTASRRIGRDPRPRAEREQSATLAANAPALSAPPRAGAASAAGLTAGSPASPAPAPPSAGAVRGPASKESSPLSLAGSEGSLTRLGGGASALGLLANQRSAGRSCSPKVGAGGPQVPRTGPYSQGNGHRGAGRGKHGGPRSVPARVSAVWR